MKKICYFIALFLSGYTALYYNAIFFRTFFVFLFLLPILLYCIMKYQRDHLSIRLLSSPNVVKKGATITMDVLLENTSRLPIPKALIGLTFENHFDTTIGKTNFFGMVDRNDTTTFKYTISSKYCGNLFIKVHSIRIYDFFNLFSMEGSVNELLVLRILPEIYKTQIAISEKTKQFQTDEEEYDPYQSGDDASEIFDFREYRQGDRPQRIHWKLSGKSEQLIIKEYSLPVGYHIILLLDLSPPSKTALSIEYMDSLIEVLSALSNELLLDSCTHFIGWYSEEEGRMIRKIIKTYDDFYEMIFIICSVTPYSEPYNMTDLYQSIFPSGTTDTIMVLDLAFKLSLRGSDIVTYNPLAIKQSLSNSNIII